ncbi:hypothetical protein B7R21_03490 [Subtercola boreus]|uniref:Uncharacterized protein n=1 Tax=Subtercola boreus TaxID=120213 RepID=A0A3E0W1B7_9MICO|nr:hypothetical protein B7R21_03490 [Subtercola boreus]
MIAPTEPKEDAVIFTVGSGFPAESTMLMSFVEKRIGSTPSTLRVTSCVANPPRLTVPKSADVPPPAVVAVKCAGFVAIDVPLNVSARFLVLLSA